MRELTVVYKWENGKEGSFIHRAFPEPLDITRACLASIEDEQYRETVAQAMSTAPAFTKQYWGWFRQVLVTWRADAKRLREGNKSTAPLNAEDTAERMSRVKLPSYDAPAESIAPEVKAANGIKALKGAALRQGLREMGIPEDSIATMAAAIEAAQ